MSNIKFKGMIPALVSPLNENGTVKEKVFRKLINWHLEIGCKGFYICGGTGEGVIMKPESRKKIAEIAVDAVKGKGFVIDHIGAIDLRTTLELTGHACEIGVDAVSSVPPFFYKYNQEEVFQYYEAISKSSSVPILIYSLSSIGGNITSEIITQIMKIKNIIGLKWSNYNLYEMGKIRLINDGDVTIFIGNDEIALPGLVMKADGGIGMTYNIMPKIFMELYDNFMSGNLIKAQEAQFKANKLINILLKHGIFAGVKDILEMIGFEVGYYSLPFKRFSKLEQQLFREELRKIKFEKEYL